MSHVVPGLERRVHYVFDRKNSKEARDLDQLNAAVRLVDLRIPPGNRLEALSGNLNGLHSIRINDQWRIIFRWTSTGPEDVRAETALAFSDAFGTLAEFWINLRTNYDLWEAQQDHKRQKKIA